MRLILFDENTFLIYLNKYFFDKIDFDSKRIIQDRLKDLFIKIKNLYNIKIYGYYKVKIYVDNNYGYVISMAKENMDYFDYSEDQIDMHIAIINTEFLYLVDDVLTFINNYNLIKYNNNYYLRVSDSINNVELGKILEHSIIIYDRANDIIKYGVGL